MPERLWLKRVAGKINPLAPVLRWGGQFASLGIALIGGWVIVHLLIGFTSPLPAPQQEFVGNPVDAAEKFSALSLFGDLPDTERPVTSPGMSDLRLLGVLTSNQPADARAIVRQDGGNKTWVLAIGQVLQAGTHVTRIEPGQVTLSAMGRESVLSLPQPPPIASKIAKN